MTRRRRFSDSFDGHASDRLIPFLPWIPLIGLALCPVMIATSMTNPRMARARKRRGFPFKTKWMTLRWRVILYSVSAVTLLIYNILFWRHCDILSYPLIDRFNNCVQDAQQGDRLDLALFYYVMPFFACIFFIKASLEAVCSNGLIKNVSSLLSKFNGRTGIVQILNLIFFFAMFLLVANRVNDGVLVGEDYIILTDFYAFSALPWIFVKIDFYDSGVSVLSVNE